MMKSYGGGEDIVGDGSENYRGWGSFDNGCL
jgi:hypothetical protein